MHSVIVMRLLRFALNQNSSGITWQPFPAINFIIILHPLKAFMTCFHISPIPIFPYSYFQFSSLIITRFSHSHKDQKEESRENKITAAGSRCLLNNTKEVSCFSVAGWKQSPGIGYSGHLNVICQSSFTESPHYYFLLLALLNNCSTVS